MHLITTIVAVFYLVKHLESSEANDTWLLSEKQVGRLVKERVDRILKEGPNNRFWHLLTQPVSNGSPKAASMLNKASEPNPVFGNPYHLKSSPVSRMLDAMSSIVLDISKEMSRNISLKQLKQLRLPIENCPYKQNIICNSSSKFQSLDGSCNNL